MKDIYQTKTKKFFSRPDYYKKGKNIIIDVSTFNKARRYEFEEFYKFLNPKNGSSLIELGSGYGRFVLPLLNLGHKVTAVDISNKSLKIIKEEAINNKLEKRLTIIESDFRKPIIKKKFDAAFCISTFHLLAKKENERINILSNLIRSIKPGGTILVIEPNPLNLFYYPFYWFYDQVSWDVEKNFIKSTEWNLKKIFRNLEIEKIKVKYVGFLPLRFMDTIPQTESVNSFVNKTPILNKFSSFIYIKGVKSF